MENSKISIKLKVLEITLRIIIFTMILMLVLKLMLNAIWIFVATLITYVTLFSYIIFYCVKRYKYENKMKEGDN